MGAISSFFQELDGRQRLLLLILLTMAGTMVVSALLVGKVMAALLEICLLIALWISRSMWSSGGSESSVAAATLALVSAVVTGYFKLLPKASEIAAKGGVHMPPFLFDSWIPSALLFALVVGAILLVNLLGPREPVAGARQTVDDPALREKSFRQRLEGFCKDIQIELNKINTDTRWSTQYFVPLDADVDIISDNKRRRRLQDLLSAIRKNRRDQIFVVLGDPGAGKSVALRTLCERLLGDVVRRKGRIPLYINLKEWTLKQPWTRLNPPKPHHLREFIEQNLASRLDVFGTNFLKDYFDRLLDNGQFFFVFDSFDEIPAVLDASDAKWLIVELSSIFEAFFLGSTGSRGIIASRYFRRPQISSIRDVCTLEIRPFSEVKIMQSLRRYNVEEAQIRELLGSRNDLVPLARNPFMVGLLVDYLRDRGRSLPRAQSEIYSSYVNSRLDAVQYVIEEHHLGRDDVVTAATAIAGEMFETDDIGLDIAIIDLERKLPNIAVSAAVDVLTKARIGRFGGLANSRFSFVHRRFNEYFFVRNLLAQGSATKLDNIPLDSKWRDSLVLYAEVCPDDEARRIAAFCWQEMMRTASAGITSDDYLRHVHCLRFLNDAFHGRLYVLDTFQDGLAAHVQNMIENHESLLMRKIAVESVGLLKQPDIEQGISLALSNNNDWITESAFNACRYIHDLPPAIVQQLAFYLSRFGFRDFAARYREIAFSLKLAPGLKKLGWFWEGRRVDICLFSFGATLLLLLNTMGFVDALILLLILRFQSVIAETFNLRHVDVSMSVVERQVSKRVWSLSLVRLCLIIGCFTHGFVFNNYLKIIMDGVAWLLSAAAMHISVPNIQVVLNSGLSGFETELGNTYLGPLGFDLLRKVVIPACLFPLYAVEYWIGGVLQVLSNPVKVLLAIGRGTIAIFTEGWQLLLAGVALLGVVGCVIAALSFYWQVWWVRGGAELLFALFGAAFAWILLNQIYINMRFRASEMRMVRNAAISRGLTRIEIEGVLSSINRVDARLFYLDRLAVAGVRPEGEWRHGYPPSFGDDPSGTKLAKLEARWLGIER